MATALTLIPKAALLPGAQGQWMVVTNKNLYMNLFWVMNVIIAASL